MMKLAEVYKQVLENTDQIVFTTDNKLVIQDWNKTAQTVLTKIGLLKGKSVISFLASDKTISRNSLLNNKKVKLVLSGKTKNNAVVLEGKHLPLGTKKLPAHLFILKQRFDQIELVEEGKRIKNIDPLEKILQNVDIVFYRVKVDESGKKNLFFISKHVSDVFGLSYNEYLSSMKNGKILQYFHKEDYPKIIKTNKDIFENKKSSQVIYRFYNRKKKKYIWIEEKGYPVLNSKGKLVEMYGIARDINDRIESEITLNHTAGFYKSIIEDNLAGYYRVNKDSKVIEANKSFAQILGFKSKEEVIGKKLQKLYKTTSDDDFIEKIILRKKLINHESEVKLLNGKAKHFLENTSYFKNNRTGEEYIEGTIFDITEFKNIQNALKESEIKYKKLFDENLVGVFRTNTTGHIYDCNQSFVEIFGFKNKRELLKREAVDLYFTKKDRQNYLRDLRQRGILKNYELHQRKFNGNPMWVLANVELVKTGKEEIIQGTLIDITAQKITNDKLIQNVDKYRKLFENASDAILIVKEWKIIDCNEISTRLLRANKKQLIGKKFSDLIAYTDLDKDQKKMYETIFVKKEASRNKVYECVLKDLKGEKKIVEIAVSMVTENEEDTYQLIIHDNTKQIQEQKELERSKENFENLIEFSPDGNIIIFQEKVIFTNVAATRILGLKNKKELINKNIASFFVPRQQPEINKLIQFVNLKKTNTRFYEYQLSGKGKKPLDVGIQLTSLKYGGLDCVNMIMYDLGLKKQLAQQELRANIAEETNKKLAREINEHKKTQDKLSDQIAMTQALLEGSQNVLIYTINKGFEITSYNSIFDKTARQIFGFDLRSTRNFKSFIDKVITEDDRAVMYERFKLAFKGESVRLEGPLQTKKGGVVWIETFINPIKKGGKVVEVSCISTDITDKKHKNEELRHSLKEKEVLLKEVHHRVKNNLQIISSILNLQTSFSNDAKVNEILRESQNRVKSMAYLHESLYQNKNFSFINFSDYLINLSKNLVHSYYISASSVELKLNVDKVDLNLDQAIPCGLIVNELLTNAVKYAFADSAKSSIISIKVTEKKGIVEIDVADNGVGLPKDFDVNKTNTLGLQLVSTLTEQLDGKLTVMNDGGARFMITFKKI
ncbi:MAG TPA: PAS domain S-box protein [Flavobacteriales bacterium]|nr:PAS domain S-box protein [Flavobacteriales bacterium]